MKRRKIYYLLLLGLMTACSKPEATALLSEPETASAAAMQKIQFLNLGTKDYTIHAFRENISAAYVYTASFEARGTTDGQLQVELPVGNYQFLFTHLPGNHIRFSPSLLTPATRFEETAFIVQPDLTNGNNYLLEGDELYLQDKKADSVYRITEATTIRCTLERAVAQLVFFVKRGQKTAEGRFEPLPYSNNENIARYFNNIEVNIQGIGNSVDALSVPTGNGNLKMDYPASSYDSITNEGFAAYTGPFFFPAENDAPITVSIQLNPAATAPQPALAVTTQGVVKRNQQYIVTLWVTQDWNFVGVNAETRPIEDEINGDQNIWDDQVTQN